MKWRESRSWFSWFRCLGNGFSSKCGPRVPESGWSQFGGFPNGFPSKFRLRGPAVTSPKCSKMIKKFDDNPNGFSSKINDWNGFFASIFASIPNAFWSKFRWRNAVRYRMEPQMYSKVIGNSGLADQSWQTAIIRKKFQKWLELRNRLF